MEGISNTIRTIYTDYAINKSAETEALFSGRNLPTFVKDFIINRFSENGEIDTVAVKEYLANKMPTSGAHINMLLLDGEIVNITTRLIIKTELSSGRVAFLLPDLNISSNMYISQEVLSEHKDDLVEGENWGNITMQYYPPEGKKKGYVLMTEYRPFKPYTNLNFDDFINLRAQLSVDEWINVILSTLGYNHESFSSDESKFAMISRLIPAIEATLNFIELGPKSTGKSHIYSNLSKYCRMISGKCTRAQLVYNHATKQYGPIKNHDLIIFDEVSTLSFDDRTGEVQNFLKSFLEAGTASLTNIKITSTCGIGLAGNIALTEKMQPVSTDLKAILPDLFASSAMLDRFHAFFAGWKVDKITHAQIYYGWAIDSEFFSEYLHFMRTQNSYGQIFNKIVTFDKSDAYIRHVKAVSRVATAYCKLLFPHIQNLDELNDDDLKLFKELYNTYCLQPAIAARNEIWNQCRNIDPEYKNYPLPEFTIITDNNEEDAEAEGEQGTDIEQGTEVEPEAGAEVESGTEAEDNSEKESETEIITDTEPETKTNLDNQ